MRSRMYALAALVAAAGAVLGFEAAPASADPPVAVPMPTCCVNDVVALNGNVYALSEDPGGQGDNEQAVLVRIDPSTDTVTGSVTLLPGHTTGNLVNTDNLAVAAGSLWVVEYFDDVVVRVDPDTMSIVAQVPTGRSPDSIVSDGQSLWVALNNDRAVQRIDPGRNAVVQSIAVGSRRDTTDSPYQIAYDGSRILTSLPVSGRVARVDPGTGKVRYDAVGSDAAACARILPVAGGYWLDDTECSNSYYRWDDQRNRVSAQVNPDPLGDFGAVVAGGYLYTLEFSCTDAGCTDGQLDKRDSATGAQLAASAVDAPGPALVHYAAGAFWVGDWSTGTLDRIAYF